MKDFFIKLLIVGLVAFILYSTYFVLNTLYEDYKYIKSQQLEYDSMQIRINKLNASLDSLVSREAVIIKKHNHITNKYYENHYNIITANDSTTKNSLFSNLERYSYLHNLPPSKNNQPNN